MVRSLQCSWANQNLLQLPNFSLIVFYFNSHVWHLLLTFYLQTRKFLPKPQKSESANPRFHKILHKTYLATSFSRNTISSTFALIPELGESYAERNWYFSTMSIKNFNPSLTESESSRLIIELNDHAPIHTLHIFNLPLPLPHLLIHGSVHLSQLHLPARIDVLLHLVWIVFALMNSLSITAPGPGPGDQRKFAYLWWKFPLTSRVGRPGAVKRYHHESQSPQSWFREISREMLRTQHC